MKKKGLISESALVTAETVYESAKIELERTEIKAPFDGFVENLAKQGQLLQNGQSCASIISLTPLKIVGNVSEMMVAKIKSGLDAEINFISGEKYNTRVSFVSSAADTRTRTFRVEAETGDTFVGRLLDVAGISGTNPTNTQPILDVRNLGVNGVNNFTIMQDGSINSFGLVGYKNKNGGHITKFLNANATLSVYIIFFVAVAPASGSLVLTLPSNPERGDVIRFTEVAGSLTYNNSLVIRAPIIGGEPVALQGDTSGTKLGGLSTPYGSGELVVQNRNASFGPVSYTHLTLPTKRIV